jgi:hypothetical protein
MFEVPGTSFDALNTTLGPDTTALYRTLRPACDVPRMSTYAVGAIINRAVRRMSAGSAFVNVGVWRGFSLLSGMAGNPDRECIGIDNFSDFGGPRELFQQRFERFGSARHRFFEMDYEDYFANEHRTPIGVYLYDGDHAYDHQLRGLQVAEPFFADDCVVIVDDTNWAEPREATLDFVAGSDRDYELLLAGRTTENRHPTLWNGVMVLQATGSSGTRGKRPVDPDRAPPRTQTAEPVTAGADSLVSLVVCDPDPDAAALERTIERALAQTWPNVEVVVVGHSSDERVAETIRSFEDRIVPISFSGAPGEGLRAGLAASQGEFVALVDCHSELSEVAVRMGLMLPELVRFDSGALRMAGEGWPYRTLTAGEEIEATIPRGEPYVLVGGRRQLVQTIGPGPAVPLVARGERKDSLDDRAAIARLGQLRAEGAGFVVLLWTVFDWLSERPELEQHLRGECRCLLENDRVMIFELGTRNV